MNANLGLTRQQSRLLDYIKGYVAEHHYSPNFEEMRDAMGFKTKSAVARLVSRLEERGRIIRRRHMPRSIVLAESSVTERLHMLVAELCEDEGPERAAMALLDLAGDVTGKIRREAV